MKVSLYNRLDKSTLYHKRFNTIGLPHEEEEETPKRRDIVDTFDIDGLFEKESEEQRGDGSNIEIEDDGRVLTSIDIEDVFLDDETSGDGSDIHVTDANAISDEEIDALF